MQQSAWGDWKAFHLPSSGFAGANVVCRVGDSVALLCYVQPSLHCGGFLSNSSVNLFLRWVVFGLSVTRFERKGIPPTHNGLLPNEPTGAEAGLPPFTAGTWAAMFGPAKLPPDIAQRMNRELNAAMQRPDVREKIEKLGFDLAGSTPDEMAAFVQNQLQAWGSAFREAGMAAE